MSFKIIIINGVPNDPTNRCWGSSDTVEDICRKIENFGIDVEVIPVEKIYNHSFENCLVWPNCYWTDIQRNVLLAHFLEERNIPYIGGPSSANAYVDRALFKNHLKQNKINTPKFSIIDSGEVPSKVQFYKKPWIVKTAFDGNSKGIAVAHSKEQIKNLVTSWGTPLILEEWSKTKEYTVCFANNGNERSFFISEIECDDIFDQNKKAQGMGEYCRTVVNEDIKNDLIRLSTSVLESVPALDWGRIDILYNEKSHQYQVIDINFLPGLKGHKEPKSLFVTTFERETGLPYSELIRTIILSGIKRYPNLNNNTDPISMVSNKLSNAGPR